MIRWLLFVVLAGTLTAYSFWIYLRVDLVVPAARKLALARSLTLVTLLVLLFDVRLPGGGIGGSPSRWVLLDASLSMAATAADGSSAWTAALERARALQREGWRVVRFGAGTLESDVGEGGEPDALTTLLAPALASAAEAGAEEVRVLSDLRFEDAVAVRASLSTLPLDVAFEAFGGPVANAGIARLVVPDLPQPEGSVSAEVEVYGGPSGDSVLLEIFEEGRLVARVRVRSPSAGLLSTVFVPLPTPSTTGRVRYTASVSMGGDAFRADDSAIAYASVGHEEGALVVISLRPGWEARHLLPVLRDVTGLPAVGFLRAGPNRYVRLGRAIDRGPPADSVTVRRAAAEAAVLVVQGLAEDSEEWIKALVRRPGRRLLLPSDADGALVGGLEVAAPRAGEWYPSPDIPTSPIAGALSGVVLQGLPPLTDVMIPVRSGRQPPLQVQLRGTGAPQSVFRLIERPSGRVAVVLAAGFWRWAMRDAGREPYRKIWSGIAGWLLADREVIGAEPRPVQWVFDRGAPVRWSVPRDGIDSRIVVTVGDTVVVDTVVTGGRGVSTGRLLPGSYAYTVVEVGGDTTATGRFDVTASTLEMLTVAEEPEVLTRRASVGGAGGALGRPLRTFPWPYLLVIVLLCGEWIVRRRSGLR